MEFIHNQRGYNLQDDLSAFKRLSYQNSHRDRGWLTTANQTRMVNENPFQNSFRLTEPDDIYYRTKKSAAAQFKEA